MFRTVKYLFLFLGFVLFISCGGSSNSEKIDNRIKNDIEDNIEEESRIFGLKGKYSVSLWEESEHNMSVVYYPSNISKESPTPVIFFAPGWKSVDHNEYKTFLKFIASHGYTVIYAKDDTGDYSAKHLIKYFRQMINNDSVSPYIDSSKIGVIGHSSGGGHAFKVLQEFSSEGMGSNGRFLLVLDPWFAFDMNKYDMQTLPSNTNALFMQFGEGGESRSNGTDSRIPLSEFYLLSSIDEYQKDYQIYEDADHYYPVGDKTYNQIKGIFKPLDALMEYTFKSPKSTNAHRVALEAGSDDPYNSGHGIQSVQATSSYHYRCDGNDNSGAFRTLSATDIDYCAMER
jgi:hypothetical protein